MGTPEVSRTVVPPLIGPIFMRMHIKKAFAQNPHRPCLAGSFYVQLSGSNPPFGKKNPARECAGSIHIYFIDNNLGGMIRPS
jgi:hypothetical protein